MKLYKLKVRINQQIYEPYVACESMYEMENLIHQQISFDSEIIECNMIADESNFLIKKNEKNDIYD